MNAIFEFMASNAETNQPAYPPATTPSVTPIPGAGPSGAATTNDNVSAVPDSVPPTTPQRATSSAGPSGPGFEVRIRNRTLPLTILYL